MLKIDSLGKAHDAEPLFTDATFTLADGERAGLVGPNGTGKSTLLRIVAGLEHADEGTVATAPGDRVGLLHQQPPDAAQSLAAYLRAALGEVFDLDQRMRALEAAIATAADGAALREYGEVQERFAALDGWALHAALDDARSHLGIAHLPADAPFARLSGGEQARVMLAGVLLARPTILLLDEPTNHLDLAGLRWLEAYLAGFAGAVLVVSHDRRFLDNTVTRIVELDGVHDEPQHYRGGYTAFRDEKARRFERLLLQHRAQERYRRRLEADIARTKEQARHVERTVIRGAGAPHALKIAKRVARKAKARERRLERQMAAAEWIADPEKAPALTLSLDGVSVAGRRLAALEGVAADVGGRRVLAGVDMVVKGRERIAIVGENGAGKTTLLRLLAGELAPAAGRVSVDAAVGVLPQSHHGLPLDRGILEVYRSHVRSYEHDARAFLGHFLFEQDQLHRPLGTFSPGERSRLMIAILVSSGAELLLLDEPTNHLDFDSLDVVEEALRQFRGTIVAVSHDRAFVGAIGCGRVLEAREGRLAEIDAV